MANHEAWLYSLGDNTRAGRRPDNSIYCIDSEVNLVNTKLTY